MVYQQFFGPENESARNELEGRLIKLGKDRDRAIEDAASHKRNAALSQSDAAHYQRLIDEYKVLLGTSRRRANND